MLLSVTAMNANVSHMAM